MSTEGVGPAGKSNVPKPPAADINKLPLPLLRLVISTLDELGAEAASHVCKQWKEQALIGVRQHKASETNGIIKFILKELESSEGTSMIANGLEQLLEDHSILESVNLMQVKENQLKEREVISQHLSKLPLSELEKLDKEFTKQKNAEGSNCIALAKIYQRMKVLNPKISPDQEVIYEVGVKGLLALGHLDQAKMLARGIRGSFLHGKPALGSVAIAYVEKGNKNKAIEMIEEGCSDYDRAILCCFVAEKYALLGDVNTALEIASKIDAIPSSATKDEAYQDIIEALLVRGDNDNALVVANLFTDERMKSGALQQVAMKIAPEDKVRAKEIASTIPREKIRVKVLGDIDKL